MQNNLNWELKIKKLYDDVQHIELGYAEKWLLSLRSFGRICIFGAGQHGINWYIILKKYGIKVNKFYDSNKCRWSHEVIDGIICNSIDDDRELLKETAVIIAIRDYSQVYNQISEICKSEDNIFIATINTISFQINHDYIGNQRKLKEIFEKMQKLLKICNDEISKRICYETLCKWFLDINSEIEYNGEAYFYAKEIILSEKEYLVDAGAFDGDTIQSFMKATKNKYKKIYAFEMDKRNFNNLKENYIRAGWNTDKIELFQVGLSDKKGQVCCSSNFETSKIVENGEETCELNLLDSILHDKKVTFIKMDIEGGEMNALRGAKNTIIKHNPKLAICIYHSINDFLNIPVYIKTLNPNYKIIIRHHSFEDSETVCYAF